jgi:hypothetical protein
VSSDPRKSFCAGLSTKMRLKLAIGAEGKGLIYVALPLARERGAQLDSVPTNRCILTHKMAPNVEVSLRLSDEAL